MGRCNLVRTAGTCICRAEFDPSLLIDFEEGGDHSGKIFFGCELPPQFVDAEICSDNWGEGDRDATTDEVVPSYCVLVGADRKRCRGR